MVISIKRLDQPFCWNNRVGPIHPTVDMNLIVDVFLGEINAINSPRSKKSAKLSPGVKNMRFIQRDLVS